MLLHEAIEIQNHLRTKDFDGQENTDVFSNNQKNQKSAIVKYL